MSPARTSTKPKRYVIPKNKGTMRVAEVAITHELSGVLEWKAERVFGIDPSLGSTGWSIVDFVPRQKPLLLAHGTIKTDPPTDGKTNIKNIVERSRIAFDEIFKIAMEWPADKVAIELPIPARGRAGQGFMSQSGSMIATTLYNAVPYRPENIDLIDLNHVKLLVALDGYADKQVVKAAVKEWLEFLPHTNTDVTDSIAVTIAHALEHLTVMPEYPI